MTRETIVKILEIVEAYLDTIDEDGLPRVSATLILGTPLIERIYSHIEEYESIGVVTEMQKTIGKQKDTIDALERAIKRLEHSKEG